MKTASAGLITFMNSTKQGLSFDLWTVLLPSGTVLRWTDADVDITTLDTTPRKFTRGPVITRERVRWVRGIEVDQLQATFASSQQIVDGQRLPVYATLGGFDGASAQLERVYLNDAGVVQGSIVWFAGNITDVEPSDVGVTVTIKSLLTQLSQQLPRNVYQSGCLNNLYDATCGVNRADVTSNTSVVRLGSRALFAITLSGAGFTDGYYTLGIAKFTSGANAGLSRTVLYQSGDALVFSRPFPFDIALGNTLQVTPGCDKTMSTCTGKFNNLIRFRGVPFVPAPETIT
jgi:uncharacterized phage protein (TIGR02218 family)